MDILNELTEMETRLQAAGLKAGINEGAQHLRVLNGPRTTNGEIITFDESGVVAYMFGRWGFEYCLSTGSPGPVLPHRARHSPGHRSIEMRYDIYASGKDKHPRRLNSNPWLRARVSKGATSMGLPINNPFAAIFFFAIMCGGVLLTEAVVLVARPVLRAVASRTHQAILFLLVAGCAGLALWASPYAFGPAYEDSGLHRRDPLFPIYQHALLPAVISITATLLATLVATVSLIRLAGRRAVRA